MSDQASALAAKRVVPRRWCQSFLLVLLLAIGPAVVALALATARKAPQYEPKFTVNASGFKVVDSYVLVKTNIPYAGEVRLNRRLMIAGILIVTILVHGGAAIAVGLAFTAASGRSRRALLAASGGTLLVVFVLPWYLIILNNGQALNAAMWSFVMATNSMLSALVTRTSFDLRATLWSVMFWDAVVTLFAIGLTWWTIMAWQRRSIDLSKDKSSIMSELADGPKAVETALVGD